MKAVSSVALATLLSTAALAQTSEIPAMTVSFSFIDMDDLTPGTVTLQDIRDAGSNGGAPIDAISLNPNTNSSPGFYNVNTERGRALALDQNGALAIINPQQFFSPFDMQVDLQVTATEFGIEVGDWIGEMIIEFYYQSQLLGSVQSTAFPVAQAKFFSSAGAFDTVIVRANTAQANWVAPALYIQNATPWEPFGQGCAGSNGTPMLQLSSVPAIGSTFSLDVVNVPTDPSPWLMSIGLSNITDPAFGALPWDMDPLGAPGCFILSSVGTVTFLIHSGSTANYAVALPNNPVLTGVTFMNQAFLLDPAANSLGVITSNAGIATVQ